MTYNDKFALVIKAINDLLPQAQPDNRVKLYLNDDNKLVDLGYEEVNRILTDCQYEYGLLIILSSRFHPAPLKRINQNQEYFELHLPKGTNKLDEHYLTNIGQPLEGLSRVNFLQIYDVLLDMQEEQELTHKAEFPFSLSPKTIRFPEIYSSNSERSYIESRRKVLEFLYKEGVIGKQFVGYDGQEPDNVIDIAIQKKKLDYYLNKAKSIYSAKFKGIKPITTNNINNSKHIVCKIVYTLNNEVFLEGFTDQPLRLAKTQYNSENDNIFEYLYEHPNKEFTKKELEEQIGQEINKSFFKIVENLGFKGKIRELFFKVSKDAIYFRNPITIADFEALHINISEVTKRIQELSTNS